MKNEIQTVIIKNAKSDLKELVASLINKIKNGFKLFKLGIHIYFF